MFSNIPPTTKALLVANGVLFLLQLVLGNQAFDAFVLWPATGMPFPETFYPWQLVTYAFLHHDPFHLFSNMLPLFMFGAQLEYVWGPRRFLAYYLACAVGGGLFQLVVATWLLQHDAFVATTMGASGAVLGLILAFGMIFPNQRVNLLFPPIPMRAKTMAFLWVIVVLWGTAGSGQPGVAHFAHLGGMVFGWLLIRYWRGQPPFGRGGRRRPRPRIVR